MQEVRASPLGGWESFYVIVGTSAAALTGLQFVVISLAKDSRTSTNGDTIDAFATPTIVHFCIALLISATLSAPWPNLFGAAFLLSIGGIGGVLYSARVVWRATHQTGYTMVAEDWTWHVVFPFVSYVALFAAALSLRRTPDVALFVIAGVSLLLVYIGIHNAWDTTTYVVARDAASKANGDVPPATPPSADATASPAAAVPAESR